MSDIDTTDLISKLEWTRNQHAGLGGTAEVINDTIKGLRKLKEENDKIKDWIRRLFLSNDITSNTLQGFREEGLITIAQDTGEITYNYNT